MTSELCIRLIFWGLGLGIVIINSGILGNIFFEKKYITKHKIIIYSTFLIGLSIILALRKIRFNIHIIYMLTTSIGLILFYKEKLLYKLGATITIMDIIYMLSIFKSILLESFIPQIKNSAYVEFFIVEIGTFIAIWIISKILIKDVYLGQRKATQLNREKQISFIVMGLIYFIILYITRHTYNTPLVEGAIIPLVGVYFVIISGILCVTLMWRITKEMYEYKEHVLKRSLFKKQLSTYMIVNNLYKKEEEIRKITKENIDNLVSVLNEEKLEIIKPALKQIESQLNISKPHIITGNTLLDIVINEKYVIACNKQVEMKVNISVPEEVGIGDIDLCMLLSDILDYAISRCESITDERERNINIEGIWYKGYLMFKVYYSIPIMPEEMRISKASRIKSAILNDPYGFGMIIKAIYRYDGEWKLNTCNWGEEKFTFNLNTITHNSSAFNC